MDKRVMTQCDLFLIDHMKSFGAQAEFNTDLNNVFFRNPDLVVVQDFLAQEHNPYSSDVTRLAIIAGECANTQEEYDNSMRFIVAYTKYMMVQVHNDITRKHVHFWSTFQPKH